ncbi:hypothetical protein UFOVP991_28 [uncultured Caudovirales phage]|uniref:Uncharacterized protein n=1 Tax=uncultured Caudovirales phage TaxID=2100421 RepID=A0A6J5SDE2_9CAUD|nr:hypothetical protein UFOVP991_28 [uncultured Caudovirales phage]CAB4182869.1 hypothetical protein UFOVP1076_28 [uncultured Caudovirales phage]CAB4197491.1 hypothetical protein UFOVP1314_11 [uncultured Caudovirales phage]CAB4211403.1 hypothetical protein UFOVP1427_60 [uncultured Caudovirales phage]CAB5237955.1 hypothetical protein UFOVP1523_3 [uncultured Caudovirales phage]
MTPLLKTYSGTASYQAMSATRLLFRGRMSALTGTITLRRIGETDSVALLTTDAPIQFDGVDLSQMEFVGNSNALKVSGVVQ